MTEIVGDEMQSDCSNYSGFVVEGFSVLITCDQAFFFLKGRRKNCRGRTEKVGDDLGGDLVAQSAE